MKFSHLHVHTQFSLLDGAASIQNDSPVIGPYGVNQEGSSDMYSKGNNIVHTIRQVINNDSLFRQILLGLNKEFYHKTIDSKDVEKYISQKSGKDFFKSL